MDRLRQALGDSGLTYMGQSYGTLLGLTYAALVPHPHQGHGARQRHRSRAVVRPDHPGAGRRLREHAQRVLHLVCRQHRLPVAPGPGPHRRVGGTARRGGDVHRRRPAGAASPEWGSSTTPCSTRSTPSRSGRSWERRWRPHASGNGAPVVALSNRYNTGGSTNADAASTAIDCLDHPVSRDLATYGALAASLAASAPCSARCWRGARRAVLSGPCPRPGPSGRWPPPVHRPSSWWEPPRTQRRPTPGRSACPRSSPGRAAHPRGRRPRGLLLQRMRPGRRPDLPGQRPDAGAGHRLQFVAERRRRSAAGEAVGPASHRKHDDPARRRDDGHAGRLGRRGAAFVHAGRIARRAAAPSPLALAGTAELHGHSLPVALPGQLHADRRQWGRIPRHGRGRPTAAQSRR